MYKSNIFIKKSKPLDFILWLVSVAAWKFLAVTTALAVAGAGSDFILQHFPNHFETAMIVAVMIFYVIIDLGIVPMLKFYLNFRQSKDPNQRIFVNFIAFFLVLKVVITLTSSIWASPEAASVVTKDLKPVSEMKLKDLQKNHQAEIEKAEKAYLDAKESNRQEVANYIALNADRYQKTSIKKLGVDGWICHPNNKDPKDIQLCTEIKQLENKPFELKQHYESLLNDAGYTALKNDYSAEIVSSGAEYKRQLSRRTGYFIYLDIIALIFGIGAEYLRFIRRKAANMAADDSPTLLYILGQFFEKRQRQFLYWLEDLFDVDLNKDGHTGDPNGTPQPMPIPVKNPPDMSPDDSYSKRDIEAASALAYQRAKAEVITTDDDKANVTNEPQSVSNDQNPGITETNEKGRYPDEPDEAIDNLPKSPKTELTNANDKQRATKSGIGYIDVEGDAKSLKDIRNSFGNYFNKLGKDTITAPTFLNNLDKWLDAYKRYFEKYPEHLHIVGDAKKHYERCIEGAEKKRKELIAEKPDHTPKTDIKTLLSNAATKWNHYINFKKYSYAEN